MPGKYRTLRGRLSPYNNPYKWEILPESKRDEIKTSAKHSSGAGKAEYTNTKQGIHNEASGEGRGCSGSQVEYESTLQGCCKTPHCIQGCINKSALCQTREAMITTCLELTGLQSSVGVQNWCGTLSAPIKEFGEPRGKKSLTTNQVNDKRSGKQVLWTKIEGTTSAHFKREAMEMGCSQSSSHKEYL